MYVIWYSCVIYVSIFALGSWFDIFLFCKQKTAYEMRISDWSSDVFSSDLPLRDQPVHIGIRLMQPQTAHVAAFQAQRLHFLDDHRRHHRHDLLEHLAAFLDEQLVGLWPRLVDAAVGAVQKAAIVAAIVRKDGLWPGAAEDRKSVV